MAKVLGDTVSSMLHQESQQVHQLHMQRIKNNKAHTNNIVRMSAARQFDEPSTMRASAIEKILGAKVKTNLSP